MKKMIFMFLCVIALLVNTSQESFAQESITRDYINANPETNAISVLRIIISGYQVQVFSRNATTKAWDPRTVTYTSDNLIKYSNGTANFEITFDSYCDDIMYLQVVNSTEKKRKFMLM